MTDDSLAERFQNIHEFIPAARNNIDRNVWDYLTGASESETTMRRNRAALDALAFRHRVLTDVSNIDTSMTLYGKKLRIPVLMAPVGALEVFEPGGGGTVAEAAKEFGNGIILSSVSHPGLEVTADKAGDALKIFQLYVRGDESYIEDHLRRAIDRGYDAFAFTVDTAHYSRRERDIAKRYLRRRARTGTSAGREFQAKLTWKDIERYKNKFDIPIILKGIGCVEDAIRAAEIGVDGVYVSNHGGRQLDSDEGSIDVLQEVVPAIKGKAKIIVDGGISRGSDVVKAMALGADVVVVGRLYVYGLAAAGAPGIVRLMELLEEEIQICLGLVGVSDFKSLDPSYVKQSRIVTTPHVHSAFPLLTLPKETY